MYDIQNNESILTSIKQCINGMDEEYTAFDNELVVHINSAFMALHQLGVGPDNIFMIRDKHATWDEFYKGNILPMVISYVAAKTKLAFDTTLPQAVQQALKEQIAEYEWRLRYEIESNESEVTDND